MIFSLNKLFKCMFINFLLQASLKNSNRNQQTFVSYEIFYFLLLCLSIRSSSYSSSSEQWDTWQSEPSLKAALLSAGPPSAALPWHSLRGRWRHSYWHPAVQLFIPDPGNGIFQYAPTIIYSFFYFVHSPLIYPQEGMVIMAFRTGRFPVFRLFDSYWMNINILVHNCHQLVELSMGPLPWYTALCSLK